MSDAAPMPGPGTYHLMLRARDAADFRRAGSLQFATVPPRGAIIELDRDGGKLHAVIEAIFIPPGCDENCVGTIFIAEL